MERLEYEDIYFIQKNGFIRGIFYGGFFFDIEERLMPSYTLRKNSIVLHSGKARKTRMLIESRIRNGLFSIHDKKPCIFVDRNSQIPLIGNIGFGIVDRNTNLIEIKPITGCNLDCIYCSVDQNKRKNNFLAEPVYLYEELRKLIEYKGEDNIDIHIGGQGEPLRYKELESFISDASSLRQVSNISIDTNGQLLTQEKLAGLIKAGLTQINLSVNSLKPVRARYIAGCEGYDTCRIQNLIHLIKKSPLKLVIAPVMLKGINEEDIEEIVEYCSKNSITCAIQNFLRYTGGKKPTKQLSWESFNTLLARWEKKHKIKLIFSETDFHIHPTRELIKPFKKGDTIKARPIAIGQFDREFIAGHKNRSITVKSTGNFNCVKIMKDKHNIFYGSCSKQKKKVKRKKKGQCPYSTVETV